MEKISNKSEQKPGKVEAQNENFITIPRLQSHVDGTVFDRHPLAKAIDCFEKRVRDIVWAFAVAVPHAQRSQARLMTSLASKQKSYLKTISNSNGTEQAEAVASVLDTARNIESIFKSRMPSSIMAGLFIELFCEFDNFLGDLLRGINSLDESKFFHLKREITIGELKSLPTLDALRDDLLEKEIETLRRESYSKQFSSLEKDYEITLTKFEEWPKFIEASQRRNLFTHAGGVVSEQYISVCRATGTHENNLPNKGTVLPLTLDYFFETARIVEITGILLGQTIWRKAFHRDTELADRHLNELIYEKLRLEHFSQAVRYANFGLQPVISKHTSGVSRRVRIINKAIALSRLDKRIEVEQLLGDEDWTDTLRDFSLARAVLEDRYIDAADLMKKIGKEGELITESSYRNWPLFWNFRKSPEFLTTYEAVFGYSFKTSVAAAAMANVTGVATLDESVLSESTDNSHQQQLNKTEEPNKTIEKPTKTTTKTKIQPAVKKTAKKSRISS